MAKRADPKIETLRAERTLNPHPEAVQDEAFAGSEFLDARDLVQVKYEMVRRVRVDGASVSGSAAAFGFSRPLLSKDISHRARSVITGSGSGSGGHPGRPPPQGSHTPPVRHPRHE